MSDEMNATATAAIDELNLEDAPLLEVDYDAPEPGSRPPQLEPGVYDFKFELEDEPFGMTSWEKDGKKFYEVRHKAVITKTAEDGTQSDVTIRFIRANSFCSDKMKAAGMNSSLGDLFRSLGIVQKGGMSRLQIEQLLREADGRAHGRLSLGWRVSFDGTETVVSTAARSKKGEVKWPKGPDGKFTPMAQDPKSGQKAYGRENVLNYLLPTQPNPTGNGGGSDPFAAA